MSLRVKVCVQLRGCLCNGWLVLLNATLLRTLIRCICVCVCVFVCLSMSICVYVCACAVTAAGTFARRPRGPCRTCRGKEPLDRYILPLSLRPPVCRICGSECCLMSAVCTYVRCDPCVCVCVFVCIDDATLYYNVITHSQTNTHTYTSHIPPIDWSIDRVGRYNRY